MDYEKMYKEALERAREYWETDNDNTLDIKARGTMEYLFPELRESEDEKARKIIMLCLEECVHSDIIRDYEKDVAIAWLAKQGTSYTKRDVDDAYVKGMAFAKNELEKQKPTWREEDDSMFKSCIGAVATNDYYKGEEKEQIYDWLKSLKQRLK